MTIDAAGGGQPPLAERLRRLIAEQGPISVARFMALAVAHPVQGYYAGRDPLGEAGDFVTAPEVSQLFGELVGLAFVQHWLDLGRPPRLILAELGPGRGTLLADALRAARVAPDFLRAAAVHLVETSPVLRERQAAALGAQAPTWHDELRTVPDDAPLLLVANEFLDALPVRQFVRHRGRWHERLVGLAGDGSFGMLLGGQPVPLAAAADGLAEGAVLELAPAREAVVAEVAGRLVRQGGMALVVDYGSDAPVMLGDTLQAVRRHARVEPLAHPGEADLSSHVDFTAAAAAARNEGAYVFGPVTQALLLRRLGAELRLEQLLRRANPAQQESLRGGYRRLVEPEQMGELFKAVAIVPPGALVPPGFLPEERAVG